MYRWVKNSLLNLAGDWLRLADKRFAGVDGTKSKAFVLRPGTGLDSSAETSSSSYVQGRCLASVLIKSNAGLFGPHQTGFEAVRVSYGASTKKITVFIYEECTGSSVPLELGFLYHSDAGFAPIHEVAEGRNIRIKEFYWKLRLGLRLGDSEILPSISFRDTPTKPEKADIQYFYVVVSNDGRSCKGVRADEVQAPMDFAIVTIWPSWGDFPQRHLRWPSQVGPPLERLQDDSGNSFSEGRRGLHVRGQVRFIINNESGQSIKVKEAVLRDCRPTIEVTSAFLHCDSITGYQNTFEIVEEVSCTDDINSKPLLSSTRVFFQIELEYRSEDKATYSEIAVAGKISVRHNLKAAHARRHRQLRPGFSHGNPVSAFLQRLGAPDAISSELENGGYSLSSSKAFSTSLATSITPRLLATSTYPTHIHLHFFYHASHPGTVTHRM
ncbi:3-oxoacyl-[acyl-carrier-protein] synthase [Tulasnella sp. 427]|nr:3-oxoacyl-[acyl-carrier-protein] synthase [Tulasnella sp. 427]